MNLNRSNIVCHLGVAARKIRQELTTILKGKLLCLKIDCATRLGRHILGINIQYYCELQKDVVIYTIEQIFTVTCDNGANMIAAVKNLQSDAQVMFNPLEDEENCSLPKHYLDLTEAIEKEFYQYITLVRCAVHTMQLSVVDVVKTFDGEIRKCTAPRGEEIQTSVNKILRQLISLDAEAHQNSHFDVWNFWLMRKSTHPELYEVATLLLSVPSNQVSVERAFSALGLVLSDKRTRMNDDTLENILLIKLNQPLLEKILPDLYEWNKEDI
ncbi:uncharacterized protein LOC121591114 [Anopheles merus]|uniref:uncharacterized protein LOC121591114 n=1 Tax=Anopheles merus TaxID=30066 RepID=UPI001BE4CDE1|nr:uncharacterized protein LOC121591114 [Anopheles merus]